MLLGGDLQHGGQRARVRLHGVPDQLGHALVDEDDADVVAVQEAPGQEEKGAIWGWEEAQGGRWGPKAARSQH